VGNPERGWVAEEVGELSAWEECSGGRDVIGVSQWEVEVSQWDVEVSQREVGVSQ